MTNSQQAIVLANLNSVLQSIELFKAAISTDWETVAYHKEESRIKIIELYAYLYKHTETVVWLFNMDRNTYYYDKFFATNALTSVCGIMIGEKVGPSEAIKLYKKRFR